jgi:sulfatase maturation enzyme AslB (radical SAM superfamily)
MSTVPKFRIDVDIHRLLMDKQSHGPAPATRKDLTLPTTSFPVHPESLCMPGPTVLRERHRWTADRIYRAMRGWLFPYLRSRVLSGEFHPITAYLFLEHKCNLYCWYCWAFDNKVKSMTEDVARRSIDWLHDSGCRVLALMGGEPLLRPDFDSTAGLSGVLRCDSTPGVCCYSGC